MVSADLSNIWCRASLPQLLSQEAVLFDAHLRLGGGPEKKQGFLAFTEEERAREQTVQQASALAGMLCRPGETLVVLGGGLAAEGVRALFRLRPEPSAPRLLFLEETFSAQRWQELEEAMEQTDCAVLVLSQTGQEAALCLTLRALRRRMEHRYGREWNRRLCIAAPAESPLGRLAREEQCLAVPAVSDTLFSVSILALAEKMGLPAAQLLEGAGEMAVLCDLRSFENPVWLYVGGQRVLASAGTPRELLTASDHRGAELCRWMSRRFAASGSHSPGTVQMPEDVFALGDALFAADAFVTLWELPGRESRHAVESEWQDYDGFNALAGRDLRYVEETVMQTVRDGLMEQDIPLLSLSCDRPLNAVTLGGLAYFAELASALAAVCAGRTPGAAPRLSALREALDGRLQRKFSVL